MTEKQLRRLKRAELLELLLEQRKKNVELESEVKQLRAELSEKRLKIKNCGNIAEASLALTNIFAEAQRAADMYLENVKIRCGEEPEPATEEEDVTLTGSIPLEYIEVNLTGVQRRTKKNNAN